MADIPEVTSSDPHEMLSVGRRHLAVRDYSSAVGSLGQACELLAQKFGQQADECGEAYLWYGKSLLGLAREESGVLGDGIPQGEGGDESPDDKDEEADTVDEDNNGETEENGDDGEENKTDKDEAKDEGMEEDKSSAEDKESVAGSKNAPKSEEDDKEKADEPAASSSGKEPSAEASTSGAGAVASSDSDSEEEEVENLQVAWEVLELARDIFIKRGERGRRELADVYLHLGEVSLESETYDKAVSDMGKSLELFKELYSPDDRRIAETHYQIGLAHSLSNGFEDAISHFKTAAEILQARIKSLEAPSAKEDPNVKKYLASDPFYSIDGEVKELKELLPEIQEKIQDMIDYKTEAIRSVRESLGLPPNGQSSNGESSKTNGSNAAAAKPEEKKASDISHLVRRKRKPSEEAVEESSASKKPAP